MNSEAFAEQLAEILKSRACFFSELLREFADVDYRTFLLSWSALRAKYQLERDERGRYLLKKGELHAKRA